MIPTKDWSLALALTGTNCWDDWWLKFVEYGTNNLINNYDYFKFKQYFLEYIFTTFCVLNILQKWQNCYLTGEEWEGGGGVGGYGTVSSVSVPCIEGLALTLYLYGFGIVSIQLFWIYYSS